MKKRSFLNPKPGYSRLTSGRPDAGLFLAAGLLGVIVVLVLLRLVAAPVVTAIASPFWRAGTAITASVSAGSASLTQSATLSRSSDSLAAQNQSLANENAALSARISDLEKLSGHASTSVQGIPAGVLVRPPTSLYDTVIVAVPRGATVASGNEVLADGGIPVGVVTGVFAGTARVQLFSTPGIETQGWAGEKRTPVTLTGVGAGAFTARVPKDEALTESDQVYVPGPGALPIGRILKIDRDPSSPTVLLYIQPFVNPFSLTWVLVSPYNLHAS